jgi:hypothetical protein
LPPATGYANLYTLVDGYALEAAMRPAVQVLATLTSVLIGIAALPGSLLLFERHPVLATAAVVGGLSAPVMLVRWLGRDLAWGLPDPREPG